MVLLQSTSINRRSWMSYIKRYKFYNNDLSVLLVSKQGGTFKLASTKHEDWESVQLLSLLFTLLICKLIFQWKRTKEKWGNPLDTWRNFCVDLTLRMVFLLVVLQELPRLQILLNLSIFAKRPTGKFIHGR